jgi:hypothetical protein
MVVLSLPVEGAAINDLRPRAVANKEASNTNFQYYASLFCGHSALILLLYTCIRSRDFRLDFRFENIQRVDYLVEKSK